MYDVIDEDYLAEKKEAEKEKEKAAKLTPPMTLTLNSYRGGVISCVKGFLPVLFLNSALPPFSPLSPLKCKFQNRHGTFDVVNNLTLVQRRQLRHLLGAEGRRQPPQDPLHAHAEQRRRRRRRQVPPHRDGRRDRDGAAAEQRQGPTLEPVAGGSDVADQGP